MKHAIVQSICESMRECLIQAKKVRRSGKPHESLDAVARARRWCEMLQDYMSEREARQIYDQAYHDIFGS